MGQQKKKKANAILDSLRIATVALDVHSASAKGAMHSIGGTVESRLKEVTIRGHSHSRGSLDPGKDKNEERVPNQSTEPSRTEEDEEDEGDAPRNGRYTLNSVKKIDHYSRRIFAGTYITFALYFFIRYHAIEGALSIDFVE